jgi:hypothetical protein
MNAAAKMKFAAIVAVLVVGGVASAADRPSGLDVWLTCRDDVKMVCPNSSLLNVDGLKRCMKDNFSQLGPRCRAAALRYQSSRPELASRGDAAR